MVAVRRRKGFIVTISIATFYILLCLLSETSHHKKKIQFIHQNETSKNKCSDSTVILSSHLDVRKPWPTSTACSQFTISHMIPACRLPTALASYPGSGNTWLRFLIESASGVFTGSLYKDLEIQMSGLWGEIRSWRDGTTIVQKTHDASQHHVQNDFKGKAILVLRNPYEAILSKHNFLYGSHHGKAPITNYDRKDWPQFVAIETNHWLDMATNWTLYSNPQQVLVIHYENVKHNLLPEMRKILNFLNLPVDELRLQCLEKYKNGLFRRNKVTQESNNVIAFSLQIRSSMDKLIDHVNQHIMIKRGYEALPLDKYKYYKQTDEEILQSLKKQKLEQKPNENDENQLQNDRTHGTQMLLKQYMKFLDIKSDSKDSNELMSSLSEKAEGVLSKAVEWWPLLQRPFARDPINDVIETSGSRIKSLSDIDLSSSLQ